MNELVVVAGPFDEEGRSEVITADERTGFVAGLLPGERARVQVVHTNKRGVFFGDVVEVLESAPDRQIVACPHFLECGGCDFLHAPISLQHQHKRGLVAAALDLPLERVEPVVPSERQRGYRAFAKLVAGPGGILGSYRPRSHDVVDMAGCLIHAPSVERVVDALRDLLQEARRSGRVGADEAALRYVLVRGSMYEERVVVTLVARQADARLPAQLAEALASRPDVARVVLHVNDDPGDALLSRGPNLVLHDAGAPEERVGAVVQTLESGAFSQVNPFGAAALHQKVVELAEPQDRTVLDLYAGSGGLGLSLAAAGAQEVWGYEALPEAVTAARQSAERMGLSGRVHYEAKSVEEALEEAPETPIVVVNPPRKGMSYEVVRALAERGAERLIYVSCHPRSLARDLEMLREAVSLEIDRVVPVDLFPETRHVETIVSARLG